MRFLLLMPRRSARLGRTSPPTAIESGLTALGKDARALSASGHHYNGYVKMTKAAYDKMVMFKGEAANHYLKQVTSFRAGDPEAGKRADDLLDVHAYAIALGLGNQEGFG